MVCPIELELEAGPQPIPGASAVIQHNDAGGAYLDRLVDWALHAVGLFNDAKAACAAVADQ